jgi:hypothetical protein
LHIKQTSETLMKHHSFTHLELQCTRIHLNQCTYRSIGPSMLTINQHASILISAHIDRSGPVCSPSTNMIYYAQAQLTRFVTDDSGFGNNLSKQPVNQRFDISETETNRVAQEDDWGRI